MLLVETPELGEELPCLRLEVPRQRHGREVDLLELHFGGVVLVELEDEVRDSLEVRIDRAVDQDLLVGEREAALQRIVITTFDRGDVRRGSPAEVHQGVEGG